MIFTNIQDEEAELVSIDRTSELNREKRQTDQSMYKRTAKCTNNTEQYYFWQVDYKIPEKCYSKEKR